MTRDSEDAVDVRVRGTFVRELEPQVGEEDPYGQRIYTWAAQHAKPDGYAQVHIRGSVGVGVCAVPPLYPNGDVYVMSHG